MCKASHLLTELHAKLKQKSFKGFLKIKNKWHLADSIKYRYKTSSVEMISPILHFGLVCSPGNGTQTLTHARQGLCHWTAFPVSQMIPKTAEFLRAKTAVDEVPGIMPPRAHHRILWWCFSWQEQGRWGAKLTPKRLVDSVMTKRSWPPWHTGITAI